MLDPDVRRVLEGGSVAHLATVLPDGGPHVVPVWVGVEGERIVFFTSATSRKARNLQRDPRAAISVAPADDPLKPAVVRGRVVEWIEGDTTWEIIDRIALRYSGEPYPRELTWVVAVVEAEHQSFGL